MRKADWNLSVFENQEVKIYLVFAEVDEEDVGRENLPVRANLLSHQLAIQEVPAFFLASPPSFFAGTNAGRPCVICFDVFNAFHAAQLPFWAVVESAQWDLPAMYTPSIVDIFQRCLTLYFLYKYRKFEPIYFSSFLFIEEDSVCTTPFFVKHVPVLSNNMLGFRTVVQNDSSVIANNPFSLSQGKFVLVSPYEHPFSIMSVSNDVITIQTMDSVISHANVMNEKYVVLTKFPRNFIKDKSIENQSSSKQVAAKQAPVIQSTSSSFRPIYSFSLSTEEYAEFFQNQFYLTEGETKEDNKEEEISVIEDSTLTPYDFLTEQCTDDEMRKIIFDTVGEEAPLPSTKQVFFMKNTQPLSPIDLNFGFPNAQIHQHESGIQNVCQFSYDLLQTPDLSVVQGDSVVSLPADRVIDGWVENQRAPLSGEKNLHPLVFLDITVSRSSVTDFIWMLSESYSKYRLGVIDQCSADTFIQHPRDVMENNVRLFIEHNRENEFLATQRAFIIVSDNNFENSIRGNAVFIKTQWIRNPSQHIIDGLAFQLYYKVREFRSCPFGSFELPDQSNQFNPLTSIFFGLRLLPAYCLPVTSNMNIHIALDLKSNIAVFTDSTAQTLKALVLSNYDVIKNYISGIPAIIGGESYGVTITVFGESFTSDQYNKMISELASLPISVLRFNPLTHIQTNLAFPGDVIVNDSEFSADCSQFDSSAHCIIVSGSLQSYSLSIYGEPFEKLAYIAKEFAAMSWASIKPGMEKRTTSFPPHISGLLKVCTPELNSLSPLEFLPPSCLDF